MIKERTLLKNILPCLDSKEAIVITGMRRTGKTTLLNFIFNKINSTNKIFLDLENPINQKYFEEINYERIKSSLEILGLNFQKKAFIFLDEIHLVKNLPSIIKYFIDHCQVKFFLTGSASFYLKNIFSESLVGRKYIFELFPLTFKEFLVFKESNLSLPTNREKINKAIFETISVLYNEYLLFGGFPEVVLKKSVQEKQKSLEDIFSSFFQLEVIRLGDFRKNNVVRDLIMLLMQRVGSKLDIQKLSNDLRVSRPTIYEYLSFLEATYFIKTINPFTKSRDAQLRKMPKVYLCDSGLVNRFAKIDKGRLFENSVFQNLRVKGGLNYYQKDGAEIDFIFNEIAYEVKLTATKKDIERLKKLSAKLGLKQFYLIAENYSELQNVTYPFLL